MATITPTLMTGSGSRAVTITTLGASDTFTYKPGTGQILVLNNVTAGALTPNIDGAGGSTVAVQGVGSVDVSTGYTTPSIGIGAYAAIPLDSISAYLKGVIAVTGGDAMEAALLEY